MTKEDLLGSVKAGLAERIDKMTKDFEALEKYTSANFYEYLLSQEEETVGWRDIFSFLESEISSIEFCGDEMALPRYTFINYEFKDGSTTKIKNNVLEHKHRYLYVYVAAMSKYFGKEGVQ